MKLRYLAAKSVLCTAAFLLNIGVASAAQPVTLTLWENGAPTLNGLDPAKENSSNPDWIHGVTNPTVTIYPADNPNGTTLLMCPGGAYFALAAMHEGADLAAPLNEKGVNLAVLKYRMPNGHSEVPADDVWRAVQLLNDNAAKFGIDVKRIGIGGASAGGHLASTVATHPKEGMNPFAFQVLVYPVISMKEGLTHGGSRENLLGKNPDAAAVEYFSNELKVTPESPQAFIVVSADDDVVPVENSLDYFEALKTNKVPVYIHVYPSGGHGWLCRDHFKYNSQVVDEMVNWISTLDFNK
ncbi:MAG: alpha/beta hydrolase [Bacteroides sp.]|nr:alpha/beta hydrolase [Bacteroides sp.]